MKFIDLNKIIEEGVSHNPKVKKKTILEKGYIPGTMFGQATFKPGQSVGEHKHDNPKMYEIFYVLSGKIEFTINGKKFNVGKNQCVVVNPEELHSQYNPYNKSTTFVYFGVLKK